MMRIVPLCFVLACCSSQPDQPGALTADDQRELNEAAAMLDANSMDADTIVTNESTVP